MNKKSFYFSILVLGFLLLAAYAVQINQIGFSDDEWLTLFVVKNKGISNLIYNYSFDRPLRGYFETYMFTLMGTNMLDYQIIGLVFRLVDTYILFVILMILFPKQIRNNLMASVVMLIYPGFLQQYHALDYQAQFFSHLAMMTSFLISLLPIRFGKRWLYLIAIPVAIGLSLVSVGVMELYVGMEMFRIFIIYCAYQQYATSNGSPRKSALLYSLPYLVGAAGFSIWRIFFFESRRATVSTGRMLADISTLEGILHAFMNFLENLFRQLIGVWYEAPIFYLKFLRPNLGWWILISLIVSGVVVFLIQRMQEGEGTDTHSYSIALLLGGLLTVVAALVPVVFGGREISFNTSYNRFTYPGMMGVGMLLVGLLSLLKNWQRYIIFYLVIVISLLVQEGNAARYVLTTNNTEETWWEFTWRAPDIQPGTTLSGLIENGSLTESYTIWGPANLLYYPQDRKVIITGEVLDQTTLEWFTNGGEMVQRKRGNKYINQFSQTLIFSKQTGSCLHLMDADHPEISETSNPLIAAVAPYSQIDRIIPSSSKVVEPDFDIFGPEPEHGWCFYYQKAQLARQNKDWGQAAAWGNEALAQGFAPADPIEWLVFAQAFRYTSDESYNVVLNDILKDKYVQGEACQVFESYSPEMADSPYINQHQTLIEDVCD